MNVSLLGKLQLNSPPGPALKSLEPDRRKLKGWTVCLRINTESARDHVHCVPCVRMVVGGHGCPGFPGEEVPLPSK